MVLRFLQREQHVTGHSNPPQSGNTSVMAPLRQNAFDHWGNPQRSCSTGVHSRFSPSRPFLGRKFSGEIVEFNIKLLQVDQVSNRRRRGPSKVARSRFPERPIDKVSNGCRKLTRKSSAHTQAQHAHECSQEAQNLRKLTRFPTALEKRTLRALPLSLQDV
jgi:hypothetical protein